MPYEDFNNPVGAWVGYDTYDLGQAVQIDQQAHIDLRTFRTGVIGVPINMLEMDALDMLTLDGYTVGDLDTAFVPGFQENWSGGTLALQSGLNNFAGITIACISGMNTVTSVSGTAVSIAPLSDGYLSVALPNFPATHLSLGSSYIDISSDDSGGFADDLTDSLPLNSSLTSLTGGDAEAQFPLSQLVNSQLNSIYAVRLRLQATSSCTVTCLAVRVMSPTWEFAPVDMNTLYGFLQPTVPPTGSVTQGYTFPATTVSGVPSTQWPILLFSDGDLGYQILDANVGVHIHAGANQHSNRFIFYLREFPIIPYTMSVLDDLTMAEIEDLGVMPDGEPGALDDFSVTEFLSVMMQWGTTNAVVIGNQAGPIYTFTPNFAADTDYYLQATLSDDSLRVQIYPVDTVGYVQWGTPIFDSTAIIDSSFVIPRNGRLGFFADLRDGDTWVTDLRPQSLVFSEFETIALNSVTPVDGVRLYTDASPVTDLYDGILPSTAGVLVTPNNTKSNSGHCVQVQCNGAQVTQGVATSAMRFENFSQTEINFDILLSSNVSLELYLVGEDRVVTLPLPEIPLNQWTPVSVDTSSLYNSALPGPYQAFLVQTALTSSVWYVDNFSVPVRSVAWFGRGNSGDPWNKERAPWVDFKDTINSPYNGAMVGRGNSLQIRGQVVATDGFINGMQVLPKYAELGDFSWSDEEPISLGAPVAVAMATADGTKVSADGSQSTAPNGILQYMWDWGDGSFSYGETVTHDYTNANPSSYTVTLTVIDMYGLTDSSTQGVSNANTEMTFNAGLSFNGVLKGEEVVFVNFTANLTPTGKVSSSLET